MVAFPVRLVGVVTLPITFKVPVPLIVKTSYPPGPLKFPVKLETEGLFENKLIH
jgi:hypothetical protein